MRIYAITEKGRELAKSVNAPKSPSWRIIYFLKGRDKATDEQIAEFNGLSRGEAVATLSVLKKNGVVIEA